MEGCGQDGTSGRGGAIRALVGGWGQEGTSGWVGP